MGGFAMPKSEISAAAAALGRRGGLARAKKMTPEQHSEHLRRAVTARWAKVCAQVAESRRAQGLPGEPVQKKVGTGFVVVTKDNMNDPDVQPFLYKSSC
jgi:hypothetical protein